MADSLPYILGIRLWEDEDWDRETSMGTRCDGVTAGQEDSGTMDQWDGGSVGRRDIIYLCSSVNITLILSCRCDADILKCQSR